MIVRACHFAFHTDEGAALATLYYPGDERRLAEARLTGQVPALETHAPWPLVVVMPGVNVAPDGYRWLARRLVADGLCVVTFAAIGSLGPAGRGITPGIDLSALSAEEIGTRPSSTVLGPLLDCLRGSPASGITEHAGASAAAVDAVRAGAVAPVADGTVVAGSVLDGTPAAGLVDLDRVVLGGHSAGGTMALHNSSPAWVRGLRAVFAYGAHTMMASDLGHGESVIAAAPAEVPVLLLCGAEDGVITASSDRYRSDSSDGPHHRHDPVGRTFAEALGRSCGDSWLVELSGAGHFAVCRPVDTTSGRAFLEFGATQGDPVPDKDVQELLGDLIAAFVGVALRRRDVAHFESVVAHRLVSRWDRR
ncbi:hypothetical protein [Candidatus Poriferisodalis sp.]|uniref:hypothetical protein n=1 Tax=Candidatus Poriferisodalis sp. TaxID=3101277 RepID=UPI003B025F8A